LEETFKNYQENIDYKVEYLNGYKHYVLLSERLKKLVEEQQHQKEVEKPREFFENFFRQSPVDYHRQQELIKKENEEKRQKFIADNDPPKIKGGSFYELNKQDKLFNIQQNSLTEAEKAALNDPSLTYLGD
jgi:hypothetical protein